MFLFSLALIVAACNATEDTTVPTVAETSTSPAPTTAGDGTTQTTTVTAPVADSTTITTLPLSELRLALEPVADGFAQPVLVTNAGDDRLFVLDQPGRIWVIDAGGAAVFLDIRERVVFRNEQGLLGLAFHPDHVGNGLLYVNYTNLDGDTVVSEFIVTSDRNIADPASERIVLSIDQPARNHNGGMINFGPDGNLWIAMGDGGAGDDRFGNGQRDDTLLGAMLRVDVDPEVLPYRIPEGNVFEAAEIWAIGLRNPWRFSFDGESLWVADVGQDDIEEINRVATTDSGLNFGWPIMEGAGCFPPGSSCDPGGLVIPVDQYDHGEGCSVTGGYVYRGSEIPSLHGHYFYSDFCSGLLRSIEPGGATIDWTDQVGKISSVTSFGVDATGELYIVSGNGTIYRLVETAR